MSKPYLNGAFRPNTSSITPKDAQTYLPGAKSNGNVVSSVSISEDTALVILERGVSAIRFYWLMSTVPCPEKTKCPRTIVGKASEDHYHFLSTAKGNDCSPDPGPLLKILSTYLNSLE